MKKANNNGHIYNYLSENEEIENLIKDVTQDFKERQLRRKPYENQWQLNMNFLMGNQYCYVNPIGDVEDNSKQYFWEEREVYNHIAPLVEARISKLNKIRPKMSVVPATNSEEDINTAKISKKIINAVYHKLKISEHISKATVWSEVCGTSIYKIIWNKDGGLKVGIDANNEPIYQGEVNIEVCPPFEIFPDSDTVENIDDCMSIIHARVYHVDEIKRKWGVEVLGEEINVFSLDNSYSLGGLGYVATAQKIVNTTRKNHAIVIEKYEAPSTKYPNGRLVIVAGGKLLLIDELPYINGNDNRRGFPFVKQLSISQAGSFWGVSTIERCIPIQRAFNSVKNRKHEFLNRLCMGILTVEDGSVDTEDLAEEGLSPGKVLVYRQGSNPPSIMDTIKMPSDFTYEEEKLLNEFMLISGVSDLMLKSSVNTTNMSGTALQIVMEQDSNRIANTSDQIKYAVKNIAQHILRLYRQYVHSPRLAKIVGQDGGIDMFYWNNSSINSDDIIFETENEFGETLAQKRSMIFELLNSGLLNNEQGKMSNRIRNKTLEMLGFGIWDTQYDLDELHMKKAGKENLKYMKGENDTKVLSIDDHNLHVDEHIAFMLGEEYIKAYQKNNSIEQNLINHINEHKKFLKGE